VVAAVATPRGLAIWARCKHSRCTHTRIHAKRLQRDRGQTSIAYTAFCPPLFGMVFLALGSSATPIKSPATARCTRDMRRSSASRPVPSNTIARKTAEKNECDAPFRWEKLSYFSSICRAIVAARQRSLGSGPAALFSVAPKSRKVASCAMLRAWRNA
jgi:hypothetical protein